MGILEYHQEYEFPTVFCVTHLEVIFGGLTVSEDCPTPDWLDDLQIDHTEIKYDHPDDESGGDPDE